MNDRGVRYLIVNSDDFGMTSGVNRGIVEAHRRGILTSTSLMVNRPASDEAARMARDVPDLSIGLHLELDSAEDARAAVEQQLRFFDRLMSRPPTHLDSHHDVHRDPRALPHVIEAARLLDIPVRGHCPVRCFTKFYGQWGGETHLEQVSVENLIGTLETEIEVGATELICHAGYAAELESSYAYEREAELRTLCDPRVRETVRRTGIRLVGFRDLPTLITGSLDREGRPSWQP